MAQNDAGLNLVIDGKKQYLSSLQELRKVAATLDSVFAKTAKQIETTGAKIDGFQKKLAKIYSPNDISKLVKTTSQIQKLAVALQKVNQSLSSENAPAGIESRVKSFSSMTRAISGLKFETINAEVVAFTQNLSLLFDVIEKRTKALNLLAKAAASSMRAFKVFSEGLSNIANMEMRGARGLFGINHLMADVKNAMTFGMGRKFSPLETIANSLKKVSPLIQEFSKSIAGSLTKNMAMFVQGLEAFRQVTPGIAKEFEAITKAIKKFNAETQKQGAIQFTKNVLKEASLIGQQMQLGLEMGLKAYTDIGKKVGTTLTTSIKRTLGIQSPSRVMMSIGLDMVRGLESGLSTIGNIARSAAQKFTEAFSQQFKTLGRNMAQTGQSMIQQGMQAVTVGGVAGFITGSASSMVADFDKVLNEIRIFGDLTKDGLTEVQDVILRFSADTIFDPSQSANAFLGLQKAGLDVASAMMTLDHAGNLAAAGNLQLTDAIDMVVRAAQTFNIPFSEAARIADGYVQAANASTAEVSSLGAAMGNVGPIANQFGLEFEQVLAIVSQFQDVGILGPEAGTQLKSMLTGLTRPTKQVQDTFRELGVSLTDANGAFKDINTIINELSTAMNSVQVVTVRTNNLTSEQRKQMELAQKAYANASRNLDIYNLGLSTGAVNSENAADKMADYEQVMNNANRVIRELTGSQEDADYITKEITRSQSQNFRSIQALAGAYGASGLSVLLAAGEDSINSFVDEMQTLPTAAQIAGEMMQTFAGRMENVRGATDALIIRALSPLQQKVLTPLMDKLVELINMFAELPEPVLMAAAAAVALGTALVTIGGAVTLLSGLFLSGFGTAITVGTTLMSGLVAIIFNPIGVLGGLFGIATALASVIPLVAVVGVALVAGFHAVRNAIHLVQTNAGGAGDSLARLGQSAHQLFTAFGDALSAVISLIPFVGIETDKAAAAAQGSGLAAFFDSISEKVEWLTGKINSFQGILKGIGVDLGIINPEEEARIEAVNKLYEEQIQLQEQLAGATSKTAQATETYTVKAGDTLYDIARQAGMTLDEILALNDIENASLILPGQEIILSVGEIVDNTDIKGVQRRLDLINSEIEQMDMFKIPARRALSFSFTLSKVVSPALSRFIGENKAWSESSSRAYSSLQRVFNRLRVTVRQLGSVFKLLGSILDGDTEKVDVLFRNVKSILGGTWNTIKAEFETLKVDVPILFRELNQAIAEKLWDGTFAEKLNGVFNNIGPKLVSEFRKMFVEFDFSTIGEIIKDNWRRVLDLIIMFSGFIFGGPVGWGITIAKWLATAIRLDFLGLGTLLEEAGILPIIEDAWKKISDGIDNIIQTMFGTGAGDRGADFSDQLARGFEPQPGIGSGIMSVVETLAETFEKLQPSMESVFSKISEGIALFSGSLGSIDSAAVETIINAIIDLVNELIEFGGEIAQYGLTQIEYLFTNILPPLGDILAGLVNALGAEDTEGVIDGITQALDGLVNLLKGVGIAVGNNIIFILEQLLDIELPTIDVILQEWANAINGAIITIGIAVDNIKRGVGLFFLDLQIAILKPIVDLAQEIERIAQEMGINLMDFGIDTSSIRFTLQDKQYDRAFLEIANQAEQAMQRQLEEQGGITLDLPVELGNINEQFGVSTMFGGTSNLEELLMASLRNNTLSESGKSMAREMVMGIIQDISSTMGEGADFSEIIPLAGMLGIDAEGVHADMLASAAAVAEGLAEGLENNEGTVEAAAVSVAQSIEDSIREELGIHSPSEEAKLWGIAIIDGLLLGMMEKSEELLETLTAYMNDFIKLPLLMALEMVEGEGAYSLFAYRLGAGIGLGIAQGLLSTVPLINLATLSVKAEFDFLFASVTDSTSRMAGVIEGFASRVKTAIGGITEALSATANAINEFSTNSSASTFASSVPLQQNWTGGVHRQGWGLVGERGPELVFSNRNMAVLNNRTSEAFLAGMNSARMFPANTGPSYDTAHRGSLFGGNVSNNTNYGGDTYTVHLTVSGNADARMVEQAAYRGIKNAQKESLSRRTRRRGVT